jgi:tripartite-type tricarboxylate transporter receptor subunit TctC
VNDTSSSAITRRTLCASALAAIATHAFAQAERFPSRAVQVFVPFSAGSLMDVLARAYADKLSPIIGQAVVIENKPGAGGIAASNALLAAQPDGHQMLCVSAAHSVNPLMQKLPYDTARDFSGLVLWGASPSIAVVNNNHPAKNLKQLIDMARQKPEAVSFGSAGVASGTHLCGEYFAQEAGAKLLHVPYKGGQEAVNEVLGGRLDVSFPAMGVVIPMVKSGQLRALGVTSAKRVSQLPDVPTFAEAGLPDFDYTIPFGTVVASKAPKDRVKVLALHMQALTQTPEMSAQLDKLGLVPSGIVLEEFDRYLANEQRKLASVVRNAKLGTAT